MKRMNVNNKYQCRNGTEVFDSQEISDSKENHMTSNTEKKSNCMCLSCSNEFNFDFCGQLKSSAAIPLSSIEVNTAASTVAANLALNHSYNVSSKRRKLDDGHKKQDCTIKLADLDDGHKKQDCIIKLADLDDGHKKQDCTIKLADLDDWHKKQDSTTKLADLDPKQDSTIKFADLDDGHKKQDSTTKLADLDDRHKKQDCTIKLADFDDWHKRQDCTTKLADLDDWHKRQDCTTKLADLDDWHKRQDCTTKLVELDGHKKQDSTIKLADLDPRLLEFQLKRPIKNKPLLSAENTKEESSSHTEGNVLHSDKSDSLFESSPQEEDDNLKELKRIAKLIGESSTSRRGDSARLSLSSASTLLNDKFTQSRYVGRPLRANDAADEDSLASYLKHDPVFQERLGSIVENKSVNRSWNYNEISQPNRYICGQCEKSFNKAKDFTTHLHTHFKN